MVDKNGQWKKQKWEKMLNEFSNENDNDNDYSDTFPLQTEYRYKKRNINRLDRPISVNEYEEKKTKNSKFVTKKFWKCNLFYIHFDFWKNIKFRLKSNWGTKKKDRKGKDVILWLVNEIYTFFVRWKEEEEDEKTNLFKVIISTILISAALAVKQVENFFEYSLILSRLSLSLFVSLSTFVNGSKAPFTLSNRFLSSLRSLFATSSINLSTWKVFNWHKENKVKQKTRKIKEIKRENVIYC